MRKYLQIKERILADIQAGKLKEGDQLPIREELIKQFNVTRATLDKALSELIKERSLLAIRNRGTFVASKSAINRVALIMDLDVDKWSTSVTRHTSTLEALIYVILSSSQRAIDVLRTQEVLRDLDILSSYDAIIWLQPSTSEVERIHHYRHKVLIINRYIDGFNFISTNHRQAVRDMTERFIARFGDDIHLIYLDLDIDNFVVRERREGFVEACAAHSLFYRLHPITINDFAKNVETLSWRFSG